MRTHCVWGRSAPRVDALQRGPRGEGKQTDMGGGAYEKGRLDRCRQQQLTLSFCLRLSFSSYWEAEGMKVCINYFPIVSPELYNSN